MMGKMVKNMIYFVVLLLVVLMSFGVCRQAILYPHNDASWRLIREVFYQPYFMLYGEVFADDIDPPCDSDPGLEPCETGRWITPIAMSTYLLVANILLINLLIAVFNNIFQEVNAISHQVWMFQRFTVVMAYEQKPVLPPPLIVLSHAYLLLKWLKRKARGVREAYDNGLKLFLEKDDMERLYDFEEECVEGYFREQEFKLNQSTEERVRNTTEKVDVMSQKVDDINQKENLLITTMQGVEFRTRKLEELSDQTLNHLAVIHRFMATHPHMGARGGSADTLTVEPPLAPSLKTTDRLRRFSERSEVTSDGEGGTSVVVPRRRLIRALTEVVRPDTYYDDVLPAPHFHVPVREEDEEEGSLELGHSKLDIPHVIDGRRAGSISGSSDGRGGGAHEAAGDMDLLMSKEEDITTEGESTPVATVPSQPQILPASTDSRDTTDDQQDDHKRESADMESLSEVVSLRGDACGRTVLRKRHNTRRSSEGCSDMGTSNLLGASHHYPPRRQHSQTHSEPDNSTDATSVPEYLVPHGAHMSHAPPRSNRQMLLAMHAEYTSITDELETVCGLLSPPRTPSENIELHQPLLPGNGQIYVPRRIRDNMTAKKLFITTARRLLSPPRPNSPPGRRRHASEMSNPEMAIFIEKERLRDAEENDYLLMENLIQRRYEDEEESGSGAGEGVLLEEEVDEIGGLTMRRPTIGSGTHLLSVSESREGRAPGRQLRRASAVEVREPLSPHRTSHHRGGDTELLLPVPASPQSHTVRQSSGTTHDGRRKMSHPVFMRQFSQDFP